MKSIHPIQLRFFLAAFYIHFGLAALAQADSLKRSDQYYQNGMEAFDSAYRSQATKYFKLAINANPKNAKANLMAEKSIMLTIKKNQSLKYFKEAYRLDPKIDEDIVYLIGQAYHYSEEFDSALMFYEKFNNILSKLLLFERSNKISDVNRKIFECR